jgi:hypothetical protein
MGEPEGYTRGPRAKEGAAPGGPAPTPTPNPSAGPSPAPSPAPAAPPEPSEGSIEGNEGFPPDAEGDAPEGRAAEEKEKQEDGLKGDDKKQKDAEGGPKRDQEPRKASKELKEQSKAILGALAIEAQVEAPRDPLMRAMSLVYQARVLREKSGGAPAALREAARLLREALRTQPNLKKANEELEALRSAIEALGKKG